MHLLNTSTLKLTYYVNRVPAYAILSHTWGDEEVTFDDIEKPHAVSMIGYQKILKSCAQARHDGFEWIWVDTCCIDKKSSAELSEAINSMYTWYWYAEVCYAYLSDVPAEPLVKSRWFKRGWTLQELLAPAIVEFYSWEWKRIGTKSSLADDIRRATGIQKRFFLDRRNIKAASVGTKFSWAAQRTTTRLEDTAYSLLGIVDVNMPMLYGEGSRAFYRLQLEILKKTSDHTIFIWEPTLHDLEDDRRVKVPHRIFLSDKRPRGILAHSPMFFDIHRVRGIRQSTHLSSARGRPHEMTNMGLRISLPCHRYDNGQLLAFFSCKSADNSYVAAFLKPLDNDKYTRLPLFPLQYIEREKMLDTQLLDIYLETTNDKLDMPGRSSAARLNLHKLQIWDVQKEAVRNVRIVNIDFWPIRDSDIISVNLENGQLEYSVFVQSRGAIALEINERAISLLFGDHQHFTFMKLVRHGKKVNWRAVISAYDRDIAAAANNSDEIEFIRDHLEEKIDELTFRVSARRVFNQESWRTRWQLSIQIWNTAMGKPTVESSVNREYNEL